MNIAQELPGGRRNGSNWTALCPVHDDTTSLSTATPAAAAVINIDLGGGDKFALASEIVPRVASAEEEKW